MISAVDDDLDAIRRELRKAAKARARAAASLDRAAQVESDLIAQALRAGGRQVDLAADVGKTREIIRRVARRHGIGRSGPQ